MPARLEELCWLEPEIKKATETPSLKMLKNMYFFKLDTFVGSVSMKIHLFVGFDLFIESPLQRLTGTVPGEDFHYYVLSQVTNKDLKTFGLAQIFSYLESMLKAHFMCGS
jgi:hypothetical protein